MMFVSKTARFTFDSYLAAAEALLITLEDARTTKLFYQITGLTPETILRGGLTLEGQIDGISEKLSAISGATRHDL